MFGKNERVGKGYFRNAKEDELYVTSMFLTLQGEGPYAGLPAFFIRLAKCNLACSFCDTYFDGGDWLTFDEIESRIESTIDKAYVDWGKERPDWTRHDYSSGVETYTTARGDIMDPNSNLFKVLRESPPYAKKQKKMVLVITGGEPSLQKNLGNFLLKMEPIFQNTQIESNGILAFDNIPPSTTLVCSPKCHEDKQGNATKYLAPNPETLKRADCLKFVMEANQNSPYSDIPDWAHEWAQKTGKQVYISPMNVYNKEPEKAKSIRSQKNDISIEERSTVDEIISFWEPGLLNMQSNQKNHEYVAQYCVKHGYRMNLQMHLYASLA